jgi:hypothetical protein
MAPKNLRISGSLRGAVIVVLALALIVPGLAAKERKGAKIVVKRLDGQVLRGELLSVTGEGLTVLDRSTSSEVAASFGEIKDIEVVNRSKRRTGAILGGLFCGVLSAAAYPHAYRSDPDYGEVKWYQWGLLGAIGGAGTGFLIAGVSDFYSLEKTSPEHIAKVSSRLKKMARNRN